MTTAKKRRREKELARARMRRARLQQSLPSKKKGLPAAESGRDQMARLARSLGMSEVARDIEAGKYRGI
jgi:hypothetical protein